MQATIRSIAKKAGVSPATVSLALRNHPRISEATRQRIHQLAEDLGYKPNPVVSKLIAQIRAGKDPDYQSTLGAIFTAAHRSDVEQPTVQTWVASAEKRANELGYQFDRFVLCEQNLSPDRLLKILDTRDIHGLVVIGPFFHNVIDPAFDIIWERSAVVVLGERTDHPALSCVSNNQFATTYLAMDKVAELGYQRPALCVHPGIDDVVEHRITGGFFAGQNRLPKNCHVPAFDYEGDREAAFGKWFAKHRPDVILTLHHEIADWLQRLGVQVPKAVGLVHLDQTTDLPDWAGMRQHNERVGASAVDMLIGPLHLNELGLPAFQKCMFINSEWAPGPSVRKQSVSKS